MQEIARKIRSETQTALSRIADVAAPQCRELCENIYDKLPRELHDLIYEELVMDTSPQVFQIASSASGCTTRGKNTAFYPRPHDCINGVCARNTS